MNLRIGDRVKYHGVKYDLDGVHGSVIKVNVDSNYVIVQFDNKQRIMVGKNKLTRT